MNALLKNIVHAGQPSRTAHQVAILRAVHQFLDEPVVFDDPMALPVLGPQMADAVREDPFQFNDPLRRGLRAALVARSRFAEDRLAQAVLGGVKQYVVLGAGLDTFGLRNPYADRNLRVFEIDHPSTQQWKQALLQESGISVPDSMTFVPHDFENGSLADALRNGGFHFDEPAYFSWLGVTVYLEQDAVFETLRFIASLSKGSAVAFDYRLTQNHLNPMGRFIGEHIRQMVAHQGEPWKSAFDPVPFHQELGKLGFTVIEDVGPVELNAGYFARRKDALQTGGGFRLACATK